MKTGQNEEPKEDCNNNIEICETSIISSIFNTKLNKIDKKCARGGVKIIENMMDHNEDRKSEHQDIWSFEQEFIVDFIRTKLGLADTFTESDIQRCCGILATNATSLQLNKNHGKGNGLYPIYSMMNHSCV